MTDDGRRKLPEKRAAGAWVQTDRSTHEDWAKLSIKSPRASALLHLLTARVSERNAVVVSQSVLAKLMGCNRRTIIRAVDDLIAGNWIEIRQIGDRGTVNAYVLNDRVAWHGTRDGLRYSLFSANVLVSEEEQPDRDSLGNQPPLRTLPRLFTGERQLPTGDGLLPPSEPSLPGMEPDLPALSEPADRQPMDEAQSLGTLTEGLLDRIRDA